jgi:hypothetical protein
LSFFFSFKWFFDTELLQGQAPRACVCDIAPKEDPVKSIIARVLQDNELTIEQFVFYSIGKCMSLKLVILSQLQVLTQHLPYFSLSGSSFSLICSEHLEEWHDDLWFKVDYCEFSALKFPNHLEESQDETGLSMSVTMNDAIKEINRSIQDCLECTEESTLRRARMKEKAQELAARRVQVEERLARLKLSTLQESHTRYCWPHK